MTEYAACAPLLAPMALAMLALLVPRLGALFGLSGALAICVAATFAVLTVHDSGTSHIAIGGWPAPLGIELRLDGLTAVFLATIGGIAFVIALWAALDARWRSDGWFWTLFLFCLAGMGGLVVTVDAFHAYVAFELVNLSAVALIAIKGTPAALRAALSYLIVAVAGGLLYVAGIALIYASTAELQFARMGAAAGGEVHAVGCSLLVAGLLVKAALVPLHGWLPAAHSNAPSPVSALLSALVVKGPIVVMVRLQAEVLPPDLVGTVAMFVGALGALGVLWGSVQALRAVEVKRLVAYSTVAQVGYMFLAFALAPSSRDLAGLVGALIVAHAVAKAALFLAVGGLTEGAANDGQLASLPEAAPARPVAAGAAAMAFVSLMGLPPTLGFVAKWGLLGAAINEGMSASALQSAALIVVVTGTLLSAGYAFKLIKHLMTDVPRSEQPNARTGSARDMAALGLAIAALTLGLLAAPVDQLLSHPNQRAKATVGHGS